MTDVTTELAPLRHKWGWVAALGVVYFLAGWIALGSVVMATAVTVYIVGFMMIIAGAAEVIGALRMKSWGKALLWALLGLLYIIAGVVTVQNPLLAAAMLTLILGITLVASGVMRLIMAFSLRGEQSWIWVALSAVITIILGIIILLRWPVSSLYMLGLFMGVDLIMAGFGWISLALELRRENRQATT